MPHPDARIFFEFILQKIDNSRIDWANGTGQEDEFTALGAANTREKQD
jgi:hypothetical protein